MRKKHFWTNLTKAIGVISLIATTISIPFSYQTNLPLNKSTSSFNKNKLNSTNNLKTEQKEKIKSNEITNTSYKQNNNIFLLKNGPKKTINLNVDKRNNNYKVYHIHYTHGIYYKWDSGSPILSCHDCLEEKYFFEPEYRTISHKKNKPDYYHEDVVRHHSTGWHGRDSTTVTTEKALSYDYRNEYLRDDIAYSTIGPYQPPSPQTFSEQIDDKIPLNFKKMIKNLPFGKSVTLNFEVNATTTSRYTDVQQLIKPHTFSFQIDKKFNVEQQGKSTHTYTAECRDNPNPTTGEYPNTNPDSLKITNTLTLFDWGAYCYYILTINGTATNQGNENISHYDGDYTFQISSVNIDPGEDYKNNEQINAILKREMAKLKLKTRFWLSESLPKIKKMFDDKISELFNGDLRWFKESAGICNNNVWRSFDPTQWSADEIKANVDDANRTINCFWKYKPLVPELNVPTDKDGWVTINFNHWKINEDDNYYPTYDEVKAFLNNTFNNIHDGSTGNDPFTIKWMPNTKLSDPKNFDEFKREINRMMTKLARASGSSKIPFNLFWFTDDFNFPSSSTRVSSSNINEQKHEYNDQLFPLWTEKYDWNLKNQLSDSKNFDDYHATVTLNFHYHPLYPTPNGTGGCKTTDGWNIVPITIQVHEDPTVHLQETWKRFTVNGNKLSYDPDKGFSFIPQKPFDPNKNPWSSLIGKPQPEKPGPVRGTDLGIWHLYQTAHVNYFSLDGLSNNEIVTVKVGDQEPTKLDSLDGIYDFELYDPIMELPKKKQPEPTPQKKPKNANVYEITIQGWDKSHTMLITDMKITLIIHALPTNLAISYRNWNPELPILDQWQYDWVHGQKGDPDYWPQLDPKTGMASQVVWIFNPKKLEAKNKKVGNNDSAYLPYSNHPNPDYPPHLINFPDPINEKGEIIWTIKNKDESDIFNIPDLDWGFLAEGSISPKGVQWIALKGDPDQPIEQDDPYKKCNEIQLNASWENMTIDRDTTQTLAPPTEEQIQFWDKSGLWKFTFHNSKNNTLFNHYVVIGDKKDIQTSDTFCKYINHKANDQIIALPFWQTIHGQHLADYLRLLKFDNQKIRKLSAEKVMTWWQLYVKSVVLYGQNPTKTKNNLNQNYEYIKTNFSDPKELKKYVEDEINRQINRCIAPTYDQYGKRIIFQQGIDYQITDIDWKDLANISGAISHKEATITVNSVSPPTYLYGSGTFIVINDASFKELFNLDNRSLDKLWLHDSNVDNVKKQIVDKINQNLSSLSGKRIKENDWTITNFSKLVSEETMNLNDIAKWLTTHYEFKENNIKVKIFATKESLQLTGATSTYISNSKFNKDKQDLNTTWSAVKIKGNPDIKSVKQEVKNQIHEQINNQFSFTDSHGTKINLSENTDYQIDYDLVNWQQFTSISKQIPCQNTFINVTALIGSKYLIGHTTFTLINDLNIDPWDLAKIKLNEISLNIKDDLDQIKQTITYNINTQLSRWREKVITSRDWFISDFNQIAETLKDTWSNPPLDIPVTIYASDTSTNLLGFTTVLINNSNHNIPTPVHPISLTDQKFDEIMLHQTIIENAKKYIKKDIHDQINNSIKLQEHGIQLELKENIDYQLLGFEYLNWSQFIKIQKNVQTLNVIVQGIGHLKDVKVFSAFNRPENIDSYDLFNARIPDQTWQINSFEQLKQQITDYIDRNLTEQSEKKITKNDWHIEQPDDPSRKECFNLLIQQLVNHYNDPNAKPVHFSINANTGTGKLKHWTDAWFSNYKTPIKKYDLNHANLKSINLKSQSLDELKKQITNNLNNQLSILSKQKITNDDWIITFTDQLTGQLFNFDGLIKKLKDNYSSKAIIEFKSTVSANHSRYLENQTKVIITNWIKNPDPLPPKPTPKPKPSPVPSITPSQKVKNSIYITLGVIGTIFLIILSKGIFNRLKTTGGIKNLLLSAKNRRELKPNIKDKETVNNKDKNVGSNNSNNKKYSNHEKPTNPKQNPKSIKQNTNNKTISKGKQNQ